MADTIYGLLCVTAENVNAPWLLFEAGALSKYVNDSRVVPIILDLKPTDIKGPLTQFQGINASEADIYKLVTKINKAVSDTGEKGVELPVLDQSFKLWWPQLREAIDAIPAVIADVRKSERSQQEIVEEILTLVRKMDSRAVQEAGTYAEISDFGESSRQQIYRRYLKNEIFKVVDNLALLNQELADLGSRIQHDNLSLEVKAELQEKREQISKRIETLQVTMNNLNDEMQRTEQQMIDFRRQSAGKRIADG
jgi:hypothetical protein